jgi:hypothetical protein
MPKQEADLSIVLPTYSTDSISPGLPAREVTKVALRLKYQIEQVIPCELDESSITNPNSSIITNDVKSTAEAAGGEEYRSCVIFCLLVCSKWFKLQAIDELWDAPLLQCRAIACEVIAKHMYVISPPYTDRTH